LELEPESEELDESDELDESEDEEPSLDDPLEPPPFRLP
jgi:hypothetical protein